MKRSVAVVLALACAAALWLGFFVAGRDTRSEGRAAAAAASPEERQTALAARPEADLASAEGGSESARHATALEHDGVGASAAAASRAPATSGPADGKVVRIVADADGAPLPGAKVLVVPASAEGFPDQQDLEAVDRWLEEHGLRFTSDASGEVRIPGFGAQPQADGAGEDEDGDGDENKDEQHRLVVARHGELFGRAFLSSSDFGKETPPEVRLKPDALLVALVVDPLGAPVKDVPLVLQSEMPGWRSTVARATTGADGLARFPHFQVHRSGEENARWTLKVDVLLADALEKPIESSPLPAEPVRFVLPATGAAVVRVLDEAGEPWTETAEVSLSTIRPGEPRELSPFGGVKRETMSRTAESGVARFAHVEVGSSLAVSATRFGGTVPSRAYGPGPAALGAKAELSVAFGAGHPVIEVRCIGPDGAPLAGAKISVRIESSSQYYVGRAESWPVAAEDGRLRFDLETAFVETDRRIATLTFEPENEKPVSATLDLARSFEPGVHELGTVQLFAPQPFLAGRVVDSAGVGLASVDLELSRHEPEQDYWQQVWDFDLKSDADGRFESFASVIGDNFRLRAETSSLVSAPVDCKRGDTDIVVTLERGASIAGVLLLDERVPTDALHVRSAPRDVERESAVNFLTSQKRPSSDGAFEIAPLLPGAYSVWIEIDGYGQPIHSVEDVWVAGGEAARLGEIDLRGKLHVFRLTLVPPRPTNDIQGNLQHGPAGAEDLTFYKWFRTPEVDIVALDPVIDVNLNPRGYLAVELRNLREDATVTLSRGLSVRIRVRGSAPIPAPPIYLRPALVAAENGSVNDWGGDSLDDAREVVLRNVNPGRMKLAWIIERRSQQSAIATSFEPQVEQIFEVLPDVDDQLFEVTVDEAEMKEIVGALPD